MVRQGGERYSASSILSESVLTGMSGRAPTHAHRRAGGADLGLRVDCSEHSRRPRAKNDICDIG